MHTVFITGANRGMGLEFCKQYISIGYHVIATSRNPDKATELSQLKQNNTELLDIYKLNCTDPLEIENLAKVIFDKKIDILINNAATYGYEQGIETVDYNSLVNVFKANAFAPIYIVQQLLPNLRLSKESKVINITSGMGFITKKDFQPKQQYGYNGSKATLNLFTKNMAADLKEYNITVIALEPGYVLTDMTKGNITDPPKLKPEEAVSGMIKVINNINLEQTGCFIEYNGKILNEIVAR